MIGPENRHPVTYPSEVPMLAQLVRHALLRTMAPSTACSVSKLTHRHDPCRCSGRLVFLTEYPNHERTRG